MSLKLLSSSSAVISSVLILTVRSDDSVERKDDSGPQVD